MMRRLIITICYAFVWGESLQAATLWSAGVSADAGWYDFNKTFKRGAGGDDLLCWAVAASNLLAWWQDQNAKLVPQGAPTREKVWLTFQEAFENEGSDPDQGIRWWFSGKYVQQDPGGGLRCAAIRNTSLGGFYRGTGPDSEQLLYNGRGTAVTADSLTAVLLRGFGRGDAFWLGASCRRPNGSRFMHSINVWGIDEELGTDGQPQITAIYMCDSDDRARQLHRIPIRQEQGMLAFHCPEHPLYGHLGQVTLDTYTGMRVQPAERN